MQDRTAEIFGQPIYSYSRGEAIADGVLIDVSDAVQPCPFKYPVAMTTAAFYATLGAGATGAPSANGGSTLVLPSGQDIPGRAHDVFQMILATMRNRRLDPRQVENDDPSQVYFTVLIDKHGKGRPEPVKLRSVCGPGDTPDPVITIMLPNED